MSSLHEYRMWATARNIRTRKEIQCVRRVIISLSVILGVMSEENCSVSWELTTVPIFFDIRLKCIAAGSKECFGSGICKWIGGPDKEVLSFDVRVFDSQKYAVSNKKGDYWLVIKNVTARDLDISYSCHCGFYSFENILKNVSMKHSDDKDDADQQKTFMVHTPGDKKDKGKTEDVPTIVGSCVGAFFGVLVVILIVYAIIIRNKRQTGSNNTKKANREQETFIYSGNKKNSNADMENIQN